MDRSLPPPPVDVETLAQRWGCSHNLVRQLVNSGQLRSFRVGRLIRIPEAAISEFEAARAVAELPQQSAEPTPQELLMARIEARSPGAGSKSRRRW